MSARHLAVVAAFIAFGCEPTPTPRDTTELVFRERAAEVGLEIVHDNGMSGEFYIVEVIGPGGALFDYDNDGDLDLYVVRGTPLAPGWSPRPDTPGDRLFRNDLSVAADGTRRLHFTEVTAEATLGEAGYGMGAVATDFDADGWIDLYVTRFGSNQLLRNRGDGSFEDVTDRSGTDDVRWSVPALFFDYDGDGWVDLFVGNYVDFRFSNHKQCLPEQGFVDYCSPSAYRPEPDRLFRNRGDGTFEDVTAQSGIRSAFGNALGAIATDADNDGDLDLYVANDWTENQLWINRGDGRFDERGLVAGAALSIDGQPEASMGVVAEDFDADGDDDLLLTHLMGETNTLYRNHGDATFADESIDSGLGAPSWDYTGFGAVAVDYDNDGWLDVYVANGAVRLIVSLVQRDDPFPLRQRDQLFRNLDGERFVDVTDGAIAALAEVGRGVASGDVDNDGDVDLVVFNNHGPLHFLDNEVGNRRHWVGTRVVERNGVDALGARVVLMRPDGSRRSRQLRVAGSYLTSSDPRTLFGLGDDEGTVTIRVVWLDGNVEEWADVPSMRYSELRRGTGRSVVKP